MLTASVLAAVVSYCFLMKTFHQEGCAKAQRPAAEKHRLAHPGHPFHDADDSGGH